ncbi:MAG: HAMP domain-containing histidine kinase, partial [Chitinophagales bacterium]|nr:HAMP domain-containing histidine kinase [Chitinophagales bacterium]
ATSLDLRLRSNGNRDELSELASTFNDMLSRLESSFDAQKNFVSNISHELRTPLSAIIAELELALSKDRANEEYKTIIQRALSDAQKLARLSNSLLDLAKAHYDITELSYKKIRIDEVLLDARQIVLQSNPNYKIHIHFDLESENVEDITINGNEYLLRVAFANLMENGCKFSEDNSVDIHIKNIPGKVQLLFCDKGIGIPDEDIPNLFTPFFRGKNNQYAQGYGIGLSLTHKIITLHKGSIDVSSKIGQGSSFIVVLPV